MKTQMKLACLSTALVCGFGMAAHAASVTTTFDEGTQYVTENGIRSNTNTFGIDLAGMQVTATFDGGYTEVLTWASLEDPFDEYAGGVDSSFLSMVYRGWDGFALSTTRLLTSLTMDASSGNSMFDTMRQLATDPDNTPTTTVGYAYKTLGVDTLDGDIGVTYSNGIVLEGSPRGTDTFTTMTVDYSGLAGGGLLGSTLFETDLDTLAVAGDLVPVGSVSEVPLPAGFPMLLFGIAAFGFYRRPKA